MTAGKVDAGAGLESLIARVADEFQQRQARGERPDPEEFALRHPEAAGLIREVLAALRLVGLSADRAGLPDVGGIPGAGTLGDYRLLREAGRGGMGVVYEAEQVSLGRRVAVKVLPFAATMDPRQLQRFHNEARAAAGLDHPHIVPVYGVGCERGVHYYAMKFIDGRSLADVLAAGATPFRQVAEWGVQAAEALEHAHGVGVVHRDVKPANLLLDATGKLWVADFGLARTADAGLTMTGDLVGTLRYMSPEQALARHGLVDPRTDVYALGATLYELLTGRPAVEGDDRGQLLHRIASEEPVAPRRHNDRVPADLETIVLKALAKEPAERYASARGLADDLKRYLDDRPILARRPTLARRAARWARRHPGQVRWLAALSLVLVFALVGTSLVLWRKERQTSALLREKTEALRGEERAQYALRVGLADRDLASGEFRRTRLLLDRCEPRLRGWEWHYLFRASAAPPVAAKGHRARAVSPDGKYLASRTDRNELEVRDTGTARVLWKAWAGDAVAFGPDGRLCAAAVVTPESGRSVVRTFETATGDAVASLPSAPSESVTALAFSPDGSRLAVASEEGLVVWDHASQERAWAWPGASYGVAFHPEGKELASSTGRGVVVWDLATGKERLALGGYRGRVEAVAYSPDGRRLATAGPGSLVRVFEAGSGGELRHLHAHDASLQSLRFSPDGHRLVVAGKTRSTVWLGERDEDGERVDWPLHPAAFTGPTRLAVGLGARGEEIDLGRLGGTELVPLARSHPYCLAFSPDGRRLAVGCSTGQVLLRDLATGVVRSLPPHPDATVLAVAFGPDGRLVASADGDGTVRIAEAATGQATHSFRAHPSLVHGLAFRPDGRQLATAGVEGGVRLWDVGTGKELRAFDGPAACFDVAFSPDGGRLAIGGRGGNDSPAKLKVYDLVTGRALYTRRSPDEFVTRVTFSPDGERIAWSRGDAVVEVCDARTGEELFAVRGYLSAFSPDGTRLATSDSAKTVRLWDATSGEELVRLRSDGTALGLAFSPDGRLLAYLGWDGVLRLWDGSPVE